MFYLFILLCGTFLNVLMIILVTKYKKLRTLSFAISLQVVVLDLLLMTVLMTSLINIIANQWLFGEVVCSLAGLFTSFSSTLRSFLMCVFVIDRFLAVFWTFSYPKYKVKITVFLSIASWMLSFINLIPYMLDCFSFRKTSWTCGINTDCNENCSFYARARFIVIVAPSSIVPVILYILLYIKALRVSKSTAATVEIKEHHKHEWKATVTFFILFTSVFVVTFPSITILFIVSIFYRVNELPPTLHILSAAAANMIYILLITESCEIKMLGKYLGKFRLSKVVFLVVFTDSFF